MRRALLIFWIVLWLAGWVFPAAAQSYFFELTEETVHAYWNADGTLSLDYTFYFRNAPEAHSIDFVDVGLPNPYYDLKRISAWVDGQPVRVTKDYQGEGCCGVAVELGDRAIPPGEAGQVRVSINGIRRVLFPDSADPDYVSAVFSPTWFGASYVTGTTRLIVVFHFPPGMTQAEPRYHLEQGGEPEIGMDAEGRVTYTWVDPQAFGWNQYFFGASFPKKYVPVSSYRPSLLERIGQALESLAEILIPFAFLGFWCLLIPLLIVFSSIYESRRKMEYLPPLVKVEGHGIKRGLTAIEAALLLEQPLEKVITMILFSVIKKGAARLLSPEPLQIEVLEPLPQGLRAYELQFLEAMKQKDLSSRRKLLRQMMIDLIASLREKMRGFSRKETVEYYRSIVQQAWRQVEAAATPELKGELFGEALEWTMLDEEYDERARRVLTGPVAVPSWWHRYDPGWASASGGSTASSGSGRPTVPGASFAASVVRSVQSVAGGLLGGARAFTESVTRVTNPPPVSSGGSGRSGGGGCACACAGCACACAGGGR
uniref:Hypothetical conserved protein n=1 Tax=uncultured Chloroflexota bacterium TaxID=166587 RepID=H5SCX0_9CHLR|nr:hypothetical conserved protein [uncultured Chloroflexota bacterium]